MKYVVGASQVPDIKIPVKVRLGVAGSFGGRPNLPVSFFRVVCLSGTCFLRPIIRRPTNQGRKRMDEARSIIDKHVKSATICMVTIDVFQWPLKSDTLSRQWMDTEGNIWFTIFDNEEDFRSIADGHMEVFYSNAERSMFMSLVGYATRASKADQNDVFHPAYPSMNLTRDEPPFRLVKFIPERAFYWDPTRDDMVTLRLRDKMWNDNDKFKVIQ